MKKKYLILIFLFLICLGTTFATADNRSRAAEDLLNVMKTAALLEKSIDQMLQVQIQQQPELEPYKETMLKFLNKYMSYENLKNDLIKLYSEAFNEDELTEIAAFYQTPVGQKAVQKMPELLSKCSQLGAAKVQQNIGELKEMIEKEAKRNQSKESKTP